ncbi:MAG: class I SAM-dependent methyltransferase [Verrucomicrobiales bacterium]|nr:class I SAM-dependent methyltransferase [Verrucomicrobiales bacterium]
MMPPSPLPNRLPRATELAHGLIATRLGPGAIAIDATAGNGHDTVFLADRVGPDGRVHAFDIQAAAITVTRQRCESAGVADRVRLWQACHSLLGEELRQAGEATESAGAIMFNLGYLPGSDKSCLTRADTTLAALRKALDWLAPGGLLTVVAYPGHAGGDEETAAVETWSAGLDQAAFAVATYRFLNQTNPPPRLVAVERRLPDPASRTK